MKLLYFLLIAATLACSEQSKAPIYSDEEFKRDTLFVANNDSLQVIIKRSFNKDEIISTVSISEEGRIDTSYYYDNSVTLVCNKNNNTLFNKTFYKYHFSSICGEDYLTNKILYRISFERYNLEKSMFEFSVSIFTPDADIDCSVGLTVNQTGEIDLNLNLYNYDNTN